MNFEFFFFFFFFPFIFSQITDPGFEGTGKTPTTSWTVYSSLGFPVLCKQNSCGNYPIYQGSWYVWLGGSSQAQVAYVQQNATFPTTINDIQFAVHAEYSSSLMSDRFSLFIDSQEIFYINGSNYLNYNVPQYTIVTLSVVGFNDGLTHLVNFYYTSQNYSNGWLSNIYLDEVNLVLLTTTSQITTQTTPSNSTIIVVSNNNLNVVVIVPIVVGLLVLCLLIILAIFLIQRRKNRREKIKPVIVHVDPEFLKLPIIDAPILQHKTSEKDPFRDYVTNPFNSPNDSKNVISVSTINDDKENPKSKRSSRIPSTRNTYINFKELDIKTKIGKGAYGIVYYAIWRETEVAVKQILNSDMDEKEIENFSAEAELLSSLRSHPNVVLFIGVTLPPHPITIVTQFCHKGSLFKYLRENNNLEESTKLNILLGIARGVLHLHLENIIHRDLAARNILLTSNLEPKVADFGLARITSPSTNKEESKTKSDVGPIKWMSPEAIQRKVYSVKSDAWAYGVVCWEVFTNGETPYGDLDTINVAMKVVHEGLRLSIPENVPPFIKSLMKECWQLDPSQRPTFSDICAKFNQNEIGKTDVEKSFNFNPNEEFSKANNTSDYSGMPLERDDNSENYPNISTNFYGFKE